MDYPALHPARTGPPVSYLEAARLNRFSAEAHSGQTATPVSAMFQGLQEAAAISTRRAPAGLRASRIPC
jgi:hypothetical protein